MSDRYILGIDPSTHTGIAVVSETGKIIHTAEISFPKLSGFDRISAIVGEVLGIHSQYSPFISSVVIESIIVGHASSALTVIQIATILRYFFWQEGIEFLEVPPGTLKKFVCGFGNAKKEQVMMWVSKNYGFESPTNNIADAVGLAMVGACLLSGFGTNPQRVIARGLVAKKAPRKSVKQSS